MVFLVKRPTNNLVMETGPRVKVSSKRLEEQGIEPATPGLQDSHANHCAMPAPIHLGSCTHLVKGACNISCKCVWE